MNSIPRIKYDALTKRMEVRRMKPAHLARLIKKPNGQTLTGEGLRNWLRDGELMPGYAIRQIAAIFDLTPSEIASELLGIKIGPEDIPIDKAAAAVLEHLQKVARGAA